MWISQGTSFVSAKGSNGNVTEELFVLNLLLCSLVPRTYRFAFNICIPQRGVSQRTGPCEGNSYSKHCCVQAHFCSMCATQGPTLLR